MRRLFASVIAFMLIPLLLAACGGDDPTPTPVPRAAATPTPTPAPDPVVLRMLTSWDRTDPSATDTMEILQPGFERLTNGRITIDWAGDPSAVPAFEQLTPIREGIYDMSLTHPYYHSELNTLGGAQDLVWASYADREKCGLNAQVDANYTKLANIKYFPKLNGLGNGMVLDKRIETIDLSGLNIRVYPAVEPYVKGLGGSPVAMPITDVYSALDRGLVNGSVIGGGIQSALTFSWHEVIKYIIQPYAGETASAILVNGDTWDALGPENQELFQDVMAELAPEIRSSGLAQGQRSLDALLAKGMELVTLPEAEAKKLGDTWFNETSAAVLAADAVLGPKMLELAACVKARADAAG